MFLLQELSWIQYTCGTEFSPNLSTFNPKWNHTYVWQDQIAYMDYTFLLITAPSLSPLPKHFSNYVLHTFTRKKVKQSHYRPGQVQRAAQDWGSRISRQSLHERGKVVSPMHWLPLPQEIFLVLIYVKGWVNPRAIVRPEGLCQWKKFSDTVGNRTRDPQACSAVP